jgi:hypothetical protein
MRRHLFSLSSPRQSNSETSRLLFSLISCPGSRFVPALTDKAVVEVPVCPDYFGVFLVFPLVSTRGGCWYCDLRLLRFRSSDATLCLVESSTIYVGNEVNVRCSNTTARPNINAVKFRFHRIDSNSGVNGPIKAARRCLSWLIDLLVWPVPDICPSQRTKQDLTAVEEFITALQHGPSQTSDLAKETSSL